MSGPVDLLRKVLDPSLVRNDLVLSESHPDSRIAEIKLNGGKDKTLLVRLDAKNGASLFPLLNSTLGGIGRCGDYLLFVERDDETHLVAIELKSKNNAGTEAQLVGAMVIAHTLLDLVAVRSNRGKPFSVGLRRGIVFNGDQRPPKSPQSRATVAAQAFHSNLPWKMDVARLGTDGRDRWEIGYLLR